MQFIFRGNWRNCLAANVGGTAAEMYHFSFRGHARIQCKTIQGPYTGWPRSHRTPRKYAPQTHYKFTMHSAARSTV